MRQYRAFPGVRGKGMASRTLDKTGNVGEGPPEAKTPTPPSPASGEGSGGGGVRHRAVRAQVAVPGAVLAVDAALGHIAVQHVEPLLALAAADDLADPRRQALLHLFSRNRLNAGFSTISVFFEQVALVLRLQVDAPLDRKFEFLVPALKHSDSVGVIQKELGPTIRSSLVRYPRIPLFQTQVMYTDSACQYRHCCDWDGRIKR
jgi:hypothetical protein